MNAIGFIRRQACPLCGDTSSSSALVTHQMDAPPIADYLTRYYSGRVDVAALAGGEYALLRCADCGGMYQRDILNDAGMATLYEEWIAPEGSLYKKETASLAVRVGLARQCVQVIRAVNRPPHEVRVLDFGMGWGAWLLMARAFGMTAHGLELSQRRIAYAEAQGLTVVGLDALENQTYDFIMAEQVFEHLPEPLAALKSCYAALRPGGWLRIAVPNGATFAAANWQPDYMPSIPLEHINMFTPTSLSAFAERGGFVVRPAPLVLPMLSPAPAALKQWLGVLGKGVLERLRPQTDTQIWLQKPQ